MKVVAIAACPAGLMHTFMAAKAIKKLGAKKGFEVTVETQSASGVESELRSQDIMEADCVLLAIDTAVEGMERFKDKKIVKTDTTKILKKPDDIYKQMIEIIGD
ncbi:PTS fructose transporter subunit IIB [Breznakia pachnodae]|uniref:Fructose-specific phosphotransferase system IIB component n=1 Tax=Breznakia pachnodae TaxID=265178 RepID=A0ABU0E0E0_9FIRM|nr:fructose PTS transporter subunit IIB [Breznakia pachnodae]MDQ0360296.1 fructose-specific phosphotransferase system IIB component [Breznakia pachnodae]